LLILLLLACNDPCEQACAATARELAGCIEGWNADWEDLDATSRADFRSQCEEDWQALRAELEAREVKRAKEQCDAAVDEAGELSCDAWRALYLEP